MAKILISPGWGAGWSTWAEDKYHKYMLTYKPFIDFLEENPRGEITKEMLKRFEEDLRKEFNEPDAYIYTGGADHLVVEEVDGPFRVEEYDGSESITYGLDSFMTLD